MEYNYFEEDKMGMTVTSGAVTLQKNAQNMVGISVGGGAPLCPCLYVVQVFDNTPAAKDGTLNPGDEIVSISGQSVKGWTKVEVARLIQSARGDVTINFNKLHADPKQGKSLDIVLKKVKHRIVENMNSSTADALGLSRAILCNDSLVKKMQHLQATASIYKQLVTSLKCYLNQFYHLSQVHRRFGDIMAVIGAKEPQPNASAAFSRFGESHRLIEKQAIEMVRAAKPVVRDLGTFLHKAVPDTRMTVKKYLDVKFEYLSYCLKVKEMDDEEYSYAALQEPLYRVETGNYEYRLVLRCRQDARKRFAKMRHDVMVKLELLDQKKVQDVVQQLHRLVSAIAQYNDQCMNTLKDDQIFPIEVDLSQNTFTYDKSGQFNDPSAEDEDDITGSEATGQTEVAADAGALLDVGAAEPAADGDLASLQPLATALDDLLSLPAAPQSPHKSYGPGEADLLGLP